MGELEDNLETLFLLEILVDNVQFEKPAKEDDLKETCVGFQFLKYPPLIICEEDFVYMGDDEFDKQNVQFKSGKSLLFALPSLQENDPNLGSIHVWVTRRVARSEKTKIMGATDINLTGSFENLLNASAKQQVVSPISKFIKGTFQFKSEGNMVGTITAFLRVSCFGKLIVTQFEVKGKEKFSFKGLDTEKEGDDSDGKKADRDDKTESAQKPSSPDQHDNAQGPGMYPGGPGMYPGGPRMYPGGPDMYPGGPGMYPGGPGMYPGGPGMYPGGPGMYPGGPGMYPGGPGMYPGGQGMYPPGQGPMGGPGQAFTPNMAWGSKRIHGKRGTQPCGEPLCPIGCCPMFPCQHANPCGQPSCAAQLLAMGTHPGSRGIGVNVCPTDRDTNCDPDEIAAAMRAAETGRRGTGARSTTGSRKKSGKGKGKGKKKK